MVKKIIVCVDCEGDSTQLKRVWDVIQKQQIKVNFFFVGETAIQNKSVVREIAETQNIDSHTMTHSNLRKMPKENQRIEILSGKEAVEDIIGKPTYGFRAPFHAINQDTVNILNEEHFIYDLSGLYYRYDMKNVIELRPNWFREWTGLYEMLKISPHTAWKIPRILYKLCNPLIIPVHPHYSGRDAAFVKALEDFLIFAKNDSAQFYHIPEYLKEKGLWKSKLKYVAT